MTHAYTINKVWYGTHVTIPYLVGHDICFELTKQRFYKGYHPESYSLQLTPKDRIDPALVDIVVKVQLAINSAAPKTDVEIEQILQHLYTGKIGAELADVSAPTTTSKYAPNSVWYGASGFGYLIGDNKVWQLSENAFGACDICAYSSFKTVRPIQVSARVRKLEEAVLVSIKKHQPKTDTARQELLQNVYNAAAEEAKECREDDAAIIDDLEKRLAEAKTHNKLFGQRNLELVKERNAAQAEVQRLSRIVARLTEENTVFVRYKDEAAQWRNKADDAQIRLKYVKDILSNKDTELDKLRGQQRVANGIADGQVAGLKQEIETWKKHAVSLQRSLNDAEADVHNTSRALAAATAKPKGLFAKLFSRKSRNSEDSLVPDPLAHV